MPIFLAVVSGPKELVNQRYMMPRAVSTVGSDLDCDIPLEGCEDLGVAPVHARIWLDGRVMIVSPEGDNSVKVDGEEARQHRIQLNGVFSLGENLDLRFEHVPSKRRHRPPKKEAVLRESGTVRTEVQGTASRPYSETRAGGLTKEERASAKTLYVPPPEGAAEEPEKATEPAPSPSAEKTLLVPPSGVTQGEDVPITLPPAESYAPQAPEAAEPPSTGSVPMKDFGSLAAPTLPENTSIGQTTVVPPGGPEETKITAAVPAESEAADLADPTQDPNKTIMSSPNLRVEDFPPAETAGDNENTVVGILPKKDVPPPTASAPEHGLDADDFQPGSPAAEDEGEELDREVLAPPGEDDPGEVELTGLLSTEVEEDDESDLESRRFSRQVAEKWGDTRVIKKKKSED